MFFKRKIIPVKRLSLYLIVFNIVIKNKGQIAKFFIDSWSSIIYSTNPWIPFQEPPLGETVYFCYLSRRGRQANAQCKQDSGLFNLLRGRENTDADDPSTAVCPVPTVLPPSFSHPRSTAIRKHQDGKFRLASSRHEAGEDGAVFGEGGRETVFT